MALLGLAAFALFHAALALKDVTGAELGSTFVAAGATFIRVVVALLVASLWTIPVGVAIGFNRKLARIAQPLAQVAASIPATALFPVLLLFLVNMRGGLSVGAVLLMLLGTQWYILFNVIAARWRFPPSCARLPRVPLRPLAALAGGDPARHISRIW